MDPANIPPNVWLVVMTIVTAVGAGWASYLQFRSSQDKQELRILKEKFDWQHEQLGNANRRIDNQQVIIEKLMSEVAAWKESITKIHRRLADKEELCAMMLEELNNTSSHGVVVAGQNGLILMANDIIAAFSGYSLAELIGMPLITLMPERYRNQHLETVKLAIEKQSVVNREPMFLPLLRKDGNEHLVRIRIIGWVEIDARLTRFVGIFYIQPVRLV